MFHCHSLLLVSAKKSSYLRQFFEVRVVGGTILSCNGHRFPLVVLIDFKGDIHVCKCLWRTIRLKLFNLPEQVNSTWSVLFYLKIFLEICIFPCQTFVPFIEKIDGACVANSEENIKILMFIEESRNSDTVSYRKVFAVWVE